MPITSLSLLLILFIKAVLAGLAIAAPVGPVGVMCVQRTLHEGRLAGLIAGLGAACADAVFGVVAAFGVAAITDFMLAHRTWLELGGGILLLLLALRIYTKRAVDRIRRPEPHTHLAAFASTFVLTITNPITILAFAAVFASLGLGLDSLDLTGASILVGGVFLGSALWWLGIAASAGLLRNRISEDNMTWMNRGAGLLIGAFGVYALASGLMSV
ncbi:MAG: LysE family translocator [Alphaproteobacteria bacterium]